MTKDIVTGFVKECVSVLEENDGVTIETSVEELLFGAVVVRLKSHEEPTELTVKIYKEIDTLFIDRVFFNNRRQGGMSKLFEIFLRYCKKFGVHNIRIVSVITYEMSCWALRHDFEPISCTGSFMTLYDMENKGHPNTFQGDYIFCIKECKYAE